MTVTHFHETFLHQVFFHRNRPIAPKYANTEKNNTGQRFHGKTLCILINSSQKHKFRTCLFDRMNVFPIIISDCTLLSLLQLINCSKRNV